MKPLSGKVAVVAGASRGAGRGIALALGEAGATVYATGRTRRGGVRPRDNAAGTIDDTAEEVSARGGVGVAIQADYTRESDVARVFEQVVREQGRLDVLANAVWGMADAYSDGQEAMASWGKPFWETPLSAWDNMMMAGPFAYFAASVYAARLMVKAGKGLIIGVTDGVMAKGDEPAPDPNTLSDYSGQLLWELAHTCINRMLYAMAVEGKKHKIAVVTLMPGFMRTERVVQYLNTEKLRQQMGFDKSESTEYIGRAVAALAADSKVLKKSGRIHFVADLAREYGFTDVDGRVVPRFAPFG
jgi:NAD(P)-dependent dehydrogenase (short-subunit alcohol dehydrogenase family)